MRRDSRRVAKRPHHEEMCGNADRNAKSDREAERQRSRHAPVAPEVERERADHPHRALGKVQDPRTPIDEDEAEAHQCVDRSGSQPEQCEADQRISLAPISRVRR